MSKKKEEIYKKTDLLSNMFKLNKKDFDINVKYNMTRINKHKSFGLLLVYVDWCPYCVESKAVFIKIAQELQKFNLPFYLANMTKNRYLPFIETFPSLYFVSNIGTLNLIKCKREPYLIMEKFIENIEKNIGINSIKTPKTAKTTKSKESTESTESPESSESPDAPEQLDDIFINRQPHHKIENSLYNNTKAIQLMNEDIIEQPNGAIVIKNSLYNKCGILKAYASWCGYCQMSVPKITELSNKFNNPNSPVAVYVIEMTNSQNNPLNKLVEGFPTYLYVDNNRIIYPFNETLIQAQLKENEINQQQMQQINQMMQIIKS